MRSLRLYLCACVLVGIGVPLHSAGQARLLPPAKAATPVVKNSTSKNSTSSAPQKQEAGTAAIRKELHGSVASKRQPSGTGTQKSIPQTETRRADRSENRAAHRRGGETRSNSVRQSKKNSVQERKKSVRKKNDRLAAATERGKKNRQIQRRTPSRSAGTPLSAEQKKLYKEQKEETAKKRAADLAAYRKKREQKLREVRAASERRRIAALERKEERRRQAEARRAKIAHRKQTQFDS